MVAWIHGGGWLFGDRRYLPETLRPDQLFDALLVAGLAVATIDYRLSLEAAFPAQRHDAKGGGALPAGRTPTSWASPRAGSGSGPSRPAVTSPRWSG